MTPELHQAARVTLRVRGQLDYDDSESKRREELSGGPESSVDVWLKGERRVPFELSLARDLPPSYRGKDVQISWEAIATLHDRNGRELTRWTQSFQLEPGRTVQFPPLREPLAPRGSSVTAASTWGCLLFPALACFSIPLCMLSGNMRDVSENPAHGRIAGIIYGVASVIAGVGLTWWIIGKARTVSKFKAAALQPLAERFPLGSTARLRAFVEITSPLTVRKARLELSAYEMLSKLRTETVTVEVPAHLAAGAHQFDVELPIPRDFTPTFKTHLKAHCTLTLELEGLENMVLHNPLELAPEVLEAEA
ncbi:hypothetical protein NR798_03255 [Archangium gephyra]|uniref:hypothetical protein n=1 Tax=Archangium gephyra TaxID=48 RepID=UPI0035D499B0